MMLQIVVSEDQRSDTWRAARAGACTSSMFDAACAFLKTKGKDGQPRESAKRRDYRMQLITERLTGIPHEGPKAKALDWGTKTEPEARMAYELATGNLVIEAGFIDHPELLWCGGSPDGLVGEAGIIEIKCPNPETHLHTVLTRHAALAQILLGEPIEGNKYLVPEEYIAQVQGNLWVTGRQWCDFISYDPRFPQNLQLYIQRVERDDAYINEVLAPGVAKFLDEVEDCVTQILGVSA